MTRLSSEQVTAMVGRERLDDHALAEIIRLHPTAVELSEALKWVERGDALGAELRRSMTPRVAALYEILNTAGQSWDEPDAR